MCTALAQDAMCVDIVWPSDVIDSNTTFNPTVDVKNNGSDALPNVRVSFNIVRASDPTDTIYHDTTNSRQIGAGATKQVTFAGSCTPDPGDYTMTGISELPGDTNRHNDTCSTPLFVRYYDVATEIVSPRDTEAPGLIAVQVRLTNNGNVPALVWRLDIKITGGYYPDYRENIAIPVGANQLVTWSPWAYSGGTDTCTAWLTDPADMNLSNDTDIVVVYASGISGRTEMEPGAGMNLTLSPSPLTGNILHVEYSLKRAGPARVTLFDVAGRPVVGRDFDATRAGELPLDVSRLAGGVYIVRLDYGYQSVVQKLVVQR